MEEQSGQSGTQVEKTLRQRIAEDNLALFTAGREFKELSSEGLEILGRERKLSNDEFSSKDFQKAWNGDAYQDWLKRLGQAANQADVAVWTAEMAALLKKFDPGPFPITPSWPVVRMVGPSEDPVFQAAFDYHARVVAAELGLAANIVFDVSGARRTQVTQLTLGEGEPPPPSIEYRPPRELAVVVETSFPPSIPAKDRARLTRLAHKAQREVLKRLGYEVEERLRSSQKPAIAAKLRLDKDKLANLEAGDIAVELSESDSDYYDADPEIRIRERGGIAVDRSRMKKRSRRNR